jgi:hypothetical protein
VEGALLQLAAAQFHCKGRATLLANVPTLDVTQATLQTIDVGQVTVGPITVGSLVLNNADVAITSGHAVLTNVSVTISIQLSVEWHVHVGLPDWIPDIDIGDTYNLGTFSFGPVTVGNVTIPALNNVRLNVPTVTAQLAPISASLSGLKLKNVAADKIHAADVALPTAGFTISGLTIGSLQGTGIGVPAAKINQATIDRVHGDPIQIPSFALSGVQLPSAQIPAISSSAAFDIPAQLATRSPGFDAGILRLFVHITPSALSHIDRLEITNASGTASVGQVVLHDVTLPYDALHLTLSQIGINTVAIPAFSVS